MAPITISAALVAALAFAPTPAQSQELHPEATWDPCQHPIPGQGAVANEDSLDFELPVDPVDPAPAPCPAPTPAPGAPASGKYYIQPAYPDGNDGTRCVSGYVGGSGALAENLHIAECDQTFTYDAGRRTLTAGSGSPVANKGGLVIGDTLYNLSTVTDFNSTAYPREWVVEKSTTGWTIKMTSHYDLPWDGYWTTSRECPSVNEFVTLDQLGAPEYGKLCPGARTAQEWFLIPAS